jgi:hypothetical protein
VSQDPDAQLPRASFLAGVAATGPLGVLRRPIAIAPERDVPWLADAEDDRETVQMLGRAIAEYQVAPRQVSPVPYLVRPDGIEVWEPAASHPARRLVERAVRVLAAVEYGYQQTKLQDPMTKGAKMSS